MGHPRKHDNSVRASLRLPPAQVEALRRMAREAAYRLNASIDHTDLVRLALVRTFHFAAEPESVRLLDEKWEATR